MAKIGLIDVDNFKRLNDCFPNIALMKLSAWHKRKGDSVEWCKFGIRYDKVYMSKVFSFSDDVDESKIIASEIVRGGTGYAIHLEAGKERFDKTKNTNLSYEIEHIYPDYGLYGIKDTAYGFLSRGCPRGCDFCHVARKEGKCANKVADLSEFWRGQKNIEVMDPNVLACPDWEEIFQQLIDSNSNIIFNQGLDIRLMTKDKAEMLMSMKIKHVHFAWDRYEDGKWIRPKLEEFKRITGWKRSKVTVYILTNFDTTIEQDVERIEFCRSLDFCPYVMRYDKEHIKRGSEINALARYVNAKWIFWQCPSFEQYKQDVKNGLWR